MPRLYRSKAQRSLENNLYAAGSGGSERSPRYRFVLKSSPYTAIQKNPAAVIGVGAALGVVLGLFATGRRVEKRLQGRRRPQVVYAVPPGARVARSGGGARPLFVLTAVAAIGALAWKERDRLKAVGTARLRTAKAGLRDRFTRLSGEKGAYWSRKGSNGRAPDLPEAQELR